MSDKDVPEGVIEGNQERSYGNVEVSQEVSRHGSGGYTYELKRLRARHHVIIRLMATGQFTQKEVAQHLDVTPQTVSNVMRSELAQQKMAHLQGSADINAIDVLKQLEELSPLAVGQLEETMMDDSAKTSQKLKAAKEILDRAGYGKTSNVNMRHERVNDQDIREIHEEAKRKAEESGMLADANVIDDNDE